MSVEIKIPTTAGLTLNTKNKFIEDDITITLDNSLIPSGTLNITENGEHDVASYEKVNVAVAGSGESTLKKLLDYTKSSKSLVSGQATITDFTGYIEYNDTENVENMSYMFSGCTALTTPPQLNTSKAKNMQSMFENCSTLKSIPLYDTHNVTNMSAMNKVCSNLISIPQLNTDIVTDMSNRFLSCIRLENLSTRIVTDNVTNITSMFSACYKIKVIDISHYKISSTSNCSAFANSCYSLVALVIRSFGTNYVLNSNSFSSCYHILGTTNSTYNPTGAKDGYIYVPRNMIETLSSATNWSTHATQLRALEDYTLDGTTTGELDLAKMGLE